MNEKQTSNDLPNDEALVAYLDGELSAEQRMHVELQLAKDANYRQQLSQLQQSWDLLDALSKAETDEELTRSTIAMVAQDQRTATADRKGLASLYGRLPRHWMTLAVAALIGFLAIRLPMHAGRQQELRDLPIAHNLDLYRYAEGVDFLERLQAEGIFAEEESHDL